MTIPVPDAAAAGVWMQDKRLPHLPKVPGETDKLFVRPFTTGPASADDALDTGRAADLPGRPPRRCRRVTLPITLDRFRKNPRGWYDANGWNGMAERFMPVVGKYRVPDRSSW